MGENINEILLGYDIRFGPEQYVKLLWNKRLRKSNLLIPEINWPVTVDTDAWPSVFVESKEYTPLIKLKRIPIEGFYYEGGVPQYHDGFELWQDKEVMKEYYAKYKRKFLKNTILIAVVIKESENYLSLTAEILKKYQFIHPNNYPDLPKNVDFASWPFLGYDVADCFKTSGLVFCSYIKEDNPQLLRKTWVPQLNEYGLFKNWEDAVQFREMTNKRVPEHAPFYVYKLFRDPNF